MVYQMYRLQKERRKMISFVECSMAIQNALMILLEICMILELILLLVRITCFSGKNRRGGCSFFNARWKDLHPEKCLQNRHSFDILRGVWYTVRVYELKQSEMY